ncbi:MAG: Yip1 family protein, partial [Bacteroidales bacterium]
MNIIERAKNIILHPKQEWVKISEEIPDVKSIALNYVVPLSLIPAIATILGWGLIGKTHRAWGGFATTVKGWDYGVSQGVVSFISTLLAVFIAALVIDMLAPSFKSEKNFGKSFQLVAFA